MRGLMHRSAIALLFIAIAAGAGAEKLRSPDAAGRRTGVKQLVTLPYGGSDIGWGVPYVRRFPNEKISAMIAKAPWVRYTTWGGAPPD